MTHGTAAEYRLYATITSADSLGDYCYRLAVFNRCDTAVERELRRV
jgi:hypothetical protein